MMNHLIRLCVAAMAAMIVSGCANSGVTPTTFSSQSQTALLVLAGPKFVYAANTGLRRVDLNSGRFEDDYVGLSTGGLQGAQINQDGPVYFNVREVVPGDYALVSLLAVPGSTYWTCFPQGGPVFTLRPGQVTIVNSVPFWFDMDGAGPTAPVSDADVLSAFDEARRALPGLVGSAQVAPVARTIRWRSGMGATRQCSESAAFESVG